MKSATAMKIYPSAPIIVNSVSGSGYTGWEGQLSEQSIQLQGEDTFYRN
jgi:hypothetical protein